MSTSTPSHSNDLQGMHAYNVNTATCRTRWSKVAMSLNLTPPPSVPYSISWQRQPGMEVRLLSDSHCTISHFCVEAAEHSCHLREIYIWSDRIQVSQAIAATVRRAQTTLSASTASLHSSEAATVNSSQPSRSIPQKCDFNIENRVRSRWYSAAPTPSAVNAYRGQRGKEAT
jgi:hypothetical protein